MHTLTLDPREAGRILADTHGLKATAPLVPLGSELASTFRATVGAREVAVKMQASSPKELAVQRWRAAVASRLSAQGHPVPSTLPARDGTIVATATHQGRDVAVTVTEWIPAAPYGELGDALDAVAFGRTLGATAAKLQATLVGAPRPPKPIQHTWAAHTMAETIAEHLPRVTDPEVRDIAERARSIIAETVAPVAAELPRVLVHQDLHDSNVLATPAGEIAAIIDFDDMLVGWRVAEPAIAAAYLARHSTDPAAAVAAVAAGWESVLPFTEAERAAYPALVVGRLALNATVWHVRATGDRADYARLRGTGTLATCAALLAGASSGTLATDGQAEAAGA
ncbi:phosphotransferase enzyme family protein [Leucobacter luti]|uniref:Ser/Thr protein kinase RdoA (MazF antagonist) n=1 Tax=Leucobacter luti TaxID=340320 RepID=A0A4Q7U0Y2_9MICO|nr:phosphotransferase [Leucobacter luti]MBL3698637.1 hypothetical protein [Leucobacter luti]RZT66012.1 Ser/Thr protein kinase RdoA (MazF antagonist) [Leucobacter luti]